ncbi:MAG TPA: hypothetical protein VGN28_07005, partial [Blastococcus sp.]|nr:hypothetical protein [Blastococcus sp.]
MRLARAAAAGATQGRTPRGKSRGQRSLASAGDRARGNQGSAPNITKNNGDIVAMQSDIGPTLACS